ncbi:MAG: hypothetical protein ACLUOF_09865 [Ruminococcus sp.]
MLFWTKNSRSDTMRNDAIGVFDSGMGGLTAVKELNAIRPTKTVFIYIPPGFLTAAAARRQCCAMPRKTWHFCGSMR